MDLGNHLIRFFFLPIHRYMDFHPSLPVAYCLNEISSTLSVFIIKTHKIQSNEFDSQTEPTLELLQELSMT